MAELINIGERYYIKAVVILEYQKESCTTYGYARETNSKSGMDESQITGMASSYARKYALNGLFCIDDTKDADTDEFKKTTTKPESKPVNNFKFLSNEQQDRFIEKVNSYGAVFLEADNLDVFNTILKKYGDYSKIKDAGKTSEIIRELEIAVKFKG